MAALAHRFDGPPTTAIEFLEAYEGVEGYFEFVNGKVVDMGRTTLAHGLIVSALLVALRSRVSSGLMVVPASVAVSPNERTARLPDLLVVPRQDDLKALMVNDPILLVEVLSTSTTHIDFGAKTMEYQSLPTLQHYLIVNQSADCAWVWAREDEGGWPEEPVLVRGDGTIELTALETTIPLAELREAL